MLKITLAAAGFLLFSAGASAHTIATDRYPASPEIERSGESLTQEAKVRVRSHYRRGGMTKRGYRSGTRVRSHYRRR